MKQLAVICADFQLCRRPKDMESCVHAIPHPAFRDERCDCRCLHSQDSSRPVNCEPVDIVVVQNEQELP